MARNEWVGIAPFRAGYLTLLGLLLLPLVIVVSTSVMVSMYLTFPPEDISFSLQEFVMALFLTGHRPRSVPVLAHSAFRQVLDPVVSVASTLRILSVVVVLAIATLALSAERSARQM